MKKFIAIILTFGLLTVGLQGLATSVEIEIAPLTVDSPYTLTITSAPMIGSNFGAWEGNEDGVEIYVRLDGGKRFSNHLTFENFHTFGGTMRREFIDNPPPNWDWFLSSWRGFGIRIETPTGVNVREFERVDDYNVRITLRWNRIWRFEQNFPLSITYFHPIDIDDYPPFDNWRDTMYFADLHGRGRAELIIPDFFRMDTTLTPDTTLSPYWWHHILTGRESGDRINLTLQNGYFFSFAGSPRYIDWEFELPDGLEIVDIRYDEHSFHNLGYPLSSVQFIIVGDTEFSSEDREIIVRWPAEAVMPQTQASGTMMQASMYTTGLPIVDEFVTRGGFFDREIEFLVYDFVFTPTSRNFGFTPIVRNENHIVTIEGDIEHIYKLDDDGNVLLDDETGEPIIERGQITGSNIVVTVTASMYWDGAETLSFPFRITIADPILPPPTLYDLRTENGALSPAFDPDIFEYEFTIGNPNETFRLLPQREFNEEEIIRGGANTGVRTFTIRDTETGLYNVYTIRITNWSDFTRPTLHNITVENATLSPIFDPNVFEYDVTIDDIDEPYPVLVYTRFSHHSVQRSERRHTFGWNPNIIINTYFIFTVTDEETGQSLEYTLNITNWNEHAKPRFLSLNVNNATLSPAFNSLVYDYEMTITDITQWFGFSGDLFGATGVQFEGDAVDVAGGFAVSGENIHLRVLSETLLEDTIYRIRITNWVEFRNYHGIGDDEPIIIPQPPGWGGGNRPGVAAPPTQPTDPTGLPFVDVNLSDWFYDYIGLTYRNNLMNGISPTEFAPNLPTTRAMFVTVLWRLAGSPTANAQSDFVDVASGTWYAEAVAWAAENGIVLGVGEDLFAPHVEITRKQMAAILYRYQQFGGETHYAVVVGTEFADQDEVSYWAVNAVNEMTIRGVLRGNADGTFNPQGLATRAEVAAVMVRLRILD